MKRVLIFLLLVCLLVGGGMGEALLGTKGCVAQAGSEQRKKLVGKSDKLQAVEIDATYLGYELVTHGLMGYSWSTQWYYIDAFEDTNIYFVPTGSGVTYHVYDQWDNELMKAERVENRQFHSLAMKAGGRLYISAEVRTDKDFTFSICTDKHHQPGKLQRTTLDPTCTNPGEAAYLCNLCAQPATTEPIPALGHTPGEWKEQTPATCTEPGLFVQPCTVCGEALQTQEQSATGHLPGREQIAVPATCLSKGTKTTQCTQCGEVLSSTPIAKADHTPGLMQIVTPATCTTDGAGEQRCTLCNAQLATETLPALGHTPGNWMDDRAATCTAEGVRSQYCTGCNLRMNTETVAAFGHSAGEWITAREAACLESGLRTKTCTVCGAQVESEMLPALGHSYTDWVILTEATKEQEGEQRRHCIHCGDTQHEPIEKLPKVFGIF